MKKGMVYLVGAGPGNVGLMTLRGAKLLENCQVVVYDRLVTDEILKLANEEAEKIYVGKETGNHTKIQEEINRILVEQAGQGKNVVRLKGGDPFVFGRGGEEIEALREAGIPWEVVPGVTSAIAAPAWAGIPVTHRGVSRSFHVITGHTAGGKEELPEGFENLAKLDGTLIFLMGLGNLHLITEKLAECGKTPDTPVAIVENGTRRGQRTLRGTIADIAERAENAKMKPPCVVVVGEVAALDYDCARRPRVGITGTDRMYSKIKKIVEQACAEPVDLSFLRTVPTNESELGQELRRIEKYDWIAFTSANGVNVFLDAMRREGVDIKALKRIKIAAVGQKTEETLQSAGAEVDYVPEIFSAEALAEGLKSRIHPGGCLLLPRGEGGNPELPKRLESSGVHCRDLTIYGLQEDKEKRHRVAAELEELDYLTFSSGKGVRTLMELIEAPEEYFSERTAVCIGNVTAEVLKQYGVRNVLVAEEYTAEGIGNRIAKRLDETAGNEQ